MPASHCFRPVAGVGGTFVMWRWWECGWAPMMFWEQPGWPKLVPSSAAWLEDREYAWVDDMNFSVEQVPCDRC